MPERVKVPSPTLFRARLEPEIFPLIVVSAVPPIESVELEPESAPAKVRISIPEIPWEVIKALALKVIGPEIVGVPVELVSAPTPATPEPASVSGSATSVILPEISKVAPEIILVPVLVAPSALALVTARVPAFTTTSPLNVLAADKVNFPLPDLMMPPSPAIVPDWKV